MRRDGSSWGSNRQDSALHAATWETLKFHPSFAIFRTDLRFLDANDTWAWLRVGVLFFLLPQLARPCSIANWLALPCYCIRIAVRACPSDLIGNQSNGMELSPGCKWHMSLTKCWCPTCILYIIWHQVLYIDFACLRASGCDWGLAPAKNVAEKAQPCMQLNRSEAFVSNIPLVMYVPLNAFSCVTFAFCLLVFFFCCRCAASCGQCGCFGSCEGASLWFEAAGLLQVCILVYWNPLPFDPYGCCTDMVLAWDHHGAYFGPVLDASFAGSCHLMLLCLSTTTGCQKNARNATTIQVRNLHSHSTFHAENTFFQSFSSPCSF